MWDPGPWSLWFFLSFWPIQCVVTRVVCIIEEPLWLLAPPVAAERTARPPMRSSKTLVVFSYFVYNTVWLCIFEATGSIVRWQNMCTSSSVLNPTREKSVCVCLRLPRSDVDGSIFPLFNSTDISPSRNESHFTTISASASREWPSRAFRLVAFHKCAWSVFVPLTERIYYCKTPRDSIPAAAVVSILMAHSSVILFAFGEFFPRSLELKSLMLFRSFQWD